MDEAFVMITGYIMAVWVGKSQVLFLFGFFLQESTVYLYKVTISCSRISAQLSCSVSSHSAFV